MYVFYIDGFPVSFNSEFPTSSTMFGIVGSHCLTEKINYSIKQSKNTGVRQLSFPNSTAKLSILYLILWSVFHQDKLRTPFFFFFFGRTHGIWKFPGYRFKSELQLPAYTTATATRDLSCVWELHHSSQQGWIINPLSKARDGTHIPWILVRFISAVSRQELHDSCWRSSIVVKSKGLNASSITFQLVTLGK